MARKNTILLQDGLYKYELPPEPRDEKLIMNYGLPRKEQVWRRPEIKDVKRMSVRERGEYIEAMDEKFWNGMWMCGSHLTLRFALQCRSLDPVSLSFGQATAHAATGQPGIGARSTAPLFASIALAPSFPD